MGKSQSKITENNSNNKKQETKMPINESQSDNITKNSNRNEKDKEKNSLINIENINEKEKIKLNEAINEEKISKHKNDTDSDFLPKYSFIYDSLEIKPQYKMDDIYYFFYATNLIKELNDQLENSFRKYPYMFEPIREDLREFTERLQTKKFEKKKIGFFNSLKRKIHFLFNKSDKNKEVKERAKTTAFLLSQLKNQKNHDTSQIGYFDVKKNKFQYVNFINDPLYKEIKICFSEETKNYNDYIQILDKKFKEIEKMIKNDGKNKVLINYFIREADKTLLDIEYLPNLDS